MFLPYLLRRAGLRILLGLRWLLWILLAPVAVPYLALTGPGYRRALTDAAGELGLTPAGEDGRVLHGEIGTKTVILRPDDRATVAVLFATRIPLMLAYEDRSRHSSNQRRLDTTSWKLARRFDTRFIEAGTLDEYGDRIKSLWDRIADFDNDRMWFLREMAVEREGLVCRLRHYPGIPRIAVSRLRPLVEDLLELANELTTAFGEDPRRPVDPEAFLR